MQTQHAAKLSLIAVAAALALAGCKKNEPMAAPGPAPLPAPTTSAPSEAVTNVPVVNVQSVTIGTNVAEDNTVHPQAVLTARDPIIVSINTEGAGQNVPVSARLTYQDGQVAGEQSAVLNTDGEEITHLTFSNAKPWPAGKYNVHVTLNGKAVGLPQQIEVR